MRRLIEIARTGLQTLLLHPLRNSVTLFALMVMLVPYLVGVGLAKGIERDARLSLKSGGDLYVSGNQFGRNCPLPLAVVPEIEELEGVTEVVPRIVGRLALGSEAVEVVVVGIPNSRFPESVTCIDGRLPREGKLDEFVAGTEVARRLKLKAGALLPPFYHHPAGDHVSRIVGVFESDVSLWQSNLMFSTFATVEKIFAMQGLATDLVVHCKSGYEGHVGEAIRRKLSTATGMKLTVTSREELSVLLAGGQFHREGVFSLHFVIVFVIGIFVILVTTGVGLPERRREIGIMKATGWQTDEILYRSLVESLLLSIAGASVSILIAFTWLKFLNGLWIAAIFIRSVAHAPGFPVPFRLTPVPALLAFTIAFSVTMSGSIWSSWRAASVSPDEAMR